MRSALALGVSRLGAADVEDPPRDARLLLRAALGCDAVRLSLMLDEPIADEAVRRFLDWIGRRALREPVSKILGQREFWSLTFKVTADTLDPRPDTEVLVEHALAYLDHNAAGKVLDLGTGSGCILLALLHERPALTGLGVDISHAALAVAQENAAELGLSDRASFQHGSWMDGLTELFDLVVSNPPYVRTNVIADLAPEVRVHDPDLALDGGPDGLLAYKKIIAGLGGILKPGGRCFLEIGYDQSQLVSDLASAARFKSKVHHDIAGHPRCVEINT